MKQIKQETSKVKEFESIRQSGEKMLRALNQEFQEKLSFDSETIVWLDEYISNFRETFPKESINDLANAIGYILGQTIIYECGGKWEYHAGFRQWVVNIGKPTEVENPIEEVRKYLVKDDILNSMNIYFAIVSSKVEKDDWNNGAKEQVI